jgi:uncharacterized membrane protein
MTLPVALSRHIRFYIALACGLAAFAGAHFAGMDVAALAGGDVFYLVFLAICALTIVRQTPGHLKKRAKNQDEGIAIVVLVTLVTMVFFCEAAFVAINNKHGIDLAALVLAGFGAPLGWLVLHMVMAFHYADLHYFTDPDCKDGGADLVFPGPGDPGPWDFLYFSFVIGMTAQVSDVQVTTTAMRRTVLWHGLISFFFNTVFIAMAVNAAVAMASMSS